MKNDPKLTLEEARWGALSGFGLDKPSGNLQKDLFENKRVLIQRGMNIQRVEKAVDMGEGVYQFIASTDGVKRDGNIVMNSGWHFDNFARNPAFIWCHDYRALPIGKHVKWEVSGTGDASVLRVWSQFCSADLNPFADKVRRMYDEGFLRAVSIGWSPIKWEWIQSEDDGDIEGVRFVESDLLEVSAVPVPSDPDAIIEAIHRGVLSDGDMERMTEYGMLPRVSRGVAYVISNADLPSEEVTEEVTRENETTEESDMLKEITETIKALGEEVRAIREDIKAVQTRLDTPVEPIEPASIDPEEPVQEIPDETRVVGVDAEELQDEENDSGKCSCPDDESCMAACHDSAKRCMDHVAGMIERTSARGVELDKTFIMEIRSKLDALLVDPVVEAPVVDEPVVEEDDTDVELRLRSMSIDLGLEEVEPTIDDMMARAVELGFIRTEKLTVDEPVVDEEADILEKMLASLKAV